MIKQDPSPSVIRDYIAKQTCWICGKGGWRALSQHLVKKHGLPASEVRELAYMFKRERLISDELSESISKDALRRFGTRRHIPIIGEAMPKKEMSTKAKHILRRRIKEIRPLFPSEETKRKISKVHKRAYQNGKIPWNKLAKQKRIHEQRSRQSKNYWKNFKELPVKEQRRLNLEHAASRRRRIIKKCVICGGEFEVIPSQADELVTCRSKECKWKNQSIKSTGRRHAAEAIAKMSIHAKERHKKEGGLFGRKEESLQSAENEVIEEIAEVLR